MKELIFVKEAYVVVVAVDDKKAERVQNEKFEKGGHEPRPVQKANVLTQSFDEHVCEQNVEQTVN